jgi:hypothetical protein
MPGGGVGRGSTAVRGAVGGDGRLLVAQPVPPAAGEVVHDVSVRVQPNGAVKLQVDPSLLSEERRRVGQRRVGVAHHPAEVVGRPHSPLAGEAAALQDDDLPNGIDRRAAGAADIPAAPPPITTRSVCTPDS